MIEDEAKTKWCPFARCHPPNGTRGYSRNRSEDIETLQTSMCIASDCMAWRCDGWVGADPATEEMNDGYCGLAGKP